MLTRSLGALLAATVGCTTAGPPPALPSAHDGPASSATAEPSFAIVGARIFDGREVIDAGTVVVAGERIVAAGADVVPPAEARVIDGAGKTLLPGLIDSHTHTWSASHLEQAAVFGVTTELDMLSAPSAVANLEARHAARAIADLRSAGAPVTVAGGHGTQYGLDFETLARAEDAAAFVAARVAEGSDYIKLIRDDFSEWGTTRPTLDDAMLTEAIAAAHALDKLAVVHIGSAEDARVAIEAGADGLVHGYFGAHPEVAALIAARGAFVIPTLSVLHSACAGPVRGQALVADSALAPYLDPGAVGNLNASFPIATGRCDELFAGVRALHAVDDVAFE